MPPKKQQTTPRAKQAAKTRKAAEKTKGKRRSQDVRRPAAPQPALSSYLPLPSGSLPLTLPDGTSLGSLLIDVPAVQSELVGYLKPVGLDRDQAAAFASLILGRTLQTLARHVEAYLDAEIRGAATRLRVSQLADHPQRADRSLLQGVLGSYISSLKEIASTLEQGEPPPLAELSSFPSVSYLNRQIIKHGTKKQRDQLKRLLARPAQGKRGRPTVEIEDRRDVQLARQTREAAHRLEEGFTYVRKQRKAGGYKSSDEVLSPKLARMRYNPLEIDAILQAFLTLWCRREPRWANLESGPARRGCSSLARQGPSSEGRSP